MPKSILTEYMDYSTVHGVGRVKNSPFKLIKMLWVFSLFASLGMITWQVIKLYSYFKSYPISTSIEIKDDDSIEFPIVTICNTNPVEYTKIPRNSPLDHIIDDAAAEYSIDRNIFSFDDDIFDDYNYTQFDGVTKTLRNDILWATAEKFKMILSTVGKRKLLSMSQTMSEFILMCNFAGQSCIDEALDMETRTYDYGVCYTFNPEAQPPIAPTGRVGAAGPRYALEMLINVNQNESVPFVTSSTGITVTTSTRAERYFNKDKGLFISTGFEANIGLELVETLRVPGKDPTKARCLDNDPGTPLSDCKRACIQKAILEKCGCYQYFFDNNVLEDNVTVDNMKDPISGNGPCRSIKHYWCIQNATATFIIKQPPGCAGCLPPCSETVFKQNVALVGWPNKQFVPILRRILKNKVPKYKLAEFDREFVRGNLALIRIYISSLTYQSIKEEYAYGPENFISDIGGQWGLWAGFSVLSVLEIVELIFLLCSGSRKQENAVEDTHKSEQKKRRRGNKDINL